MQPSKLIDANIPREGHVNDIKRLLTLVYAIHSEGPGNIAISILCRAL